MPDTSGRSPSTCPPCWAPRFCSGRRSRSGRAAAAVLARRAGWTSLPSVQIACFLVVVLPVALAYQKYFDPFALLAVTLFARPPDFRERWDYAGVAAVCAGSVAYALSFAG